jgi:acyl-CoA reductase-like NAD-dependent aldehyde dehydrogenase
MTIGGESYAGSASFDVINPAVGAPFAEAPSCTEAELDAAVNAAAQAFPAWSRDESLRRSCLEEVAAVLKDNVDELAAIITSEQGKPLADANIEVRGCARWIRYFARLEMPDEVIQDDERARVELVHRALGPVAAITPWNFPLTSACWKFAPAMLAGNTVVVKPSPFTPLATLRLGELLRDRLPAGVLNVVSGGDELGAWLTSHPLVRKITFTGSIATGKRVAAAAAPDLKRVTLELGGNDPGIVLDDADPSEIAERVFWGAFANNGQICTAIKRLYVPERRYEEMVEALADIARCVRVGDGTEEGVQLGPINNLPQRDRVAELVDDALGRGARAAAGGKQLEGPGYFYAPTVLADLDDGERIVDEEQFGPALPVISYKSLDHAIEMANATHFGLGGSVWSSDPERASEIARRLECGTAWVNTHLALAPQQPFGGFKWSGIGVENGPSGVQEFTEVQVIHQARQ